MRKNILKILSLLFFALYIQAQTTTVLDYKITFVGMVPDYNNNTSTWTYTVSAVGSAKDLSHWVLELCRTHTVKSATPTPWSVPTNGDPTTQVYGIKWDQSLSVGSTRTYSFTLNGIYEITQVKTAIKTGGKTKVAVGYILGPSCEVQNPKAKIGNKVWLDSDKDGIQDSGENGVAGITVKLFKCDNTFVKSTTTNSLGEYYFDNLIPGDYYIQIIIPNGYIVSPKDSGTDDAVDSDIDPSSGKTICTNLAANEIDLTWDAGIYQQISPCVTSFNVTWPSQNTICEHRAEFINIDATVNILPNPSKATIKYYYKQLFPVADTAHYSQIEINSSRVITFDAFWPGVRPTDTKVELEFGIDVYDCDGKKIGNTEKFVITWTPEVCPPPSPDKPDLKIEKTSDAVEVVNGNTVNFKVKVTNLGPGNATNIRITDILPDGFNFQSVTGGAYNNITGIWTIDSLKVNQSQEITITTQISVGNLNNSAFDLGQAKGFNVFVFGDFNQLAGDVEGKMAVGGNAVLSGYTVGDKLPAGNNGDVLIVGGNLTYSSGRVYYGNVVFGNSTNLPVNAVSIGGTLRKDNLIDFASAESYLKGLSIQLKNKTANGTTELEWTTIKMKGTDPLLNIFNLDAAMMNTANATVIDVPNGSVVLVNISGTDIKWKGGLDIQGTSYHNVLYNFYEAATLTITSMETRGTVLAPLALFKQEGGFLNGQLICKSVLSATQFNLNLFVGNIPGSKELINTASISNFDQTDENPSNNTSSVMVTVKSQLDENSATNEDGKWVEQAKLSTGELIWSFAKDKDSRPLLGSWGGNIYRFDGSNYNLINSGMGVNYIWAIAVDGAGNIFAGTEKGIFYSSDNGTNWNNQGFKINDSYPEVRALIFDKSGNLIAGTWGLGIYKYSGNNWTAMNDSLRTLAIHTLTVDSENTLFAGTFDSGVYRMRAGENYWTKTSIANDYIWTLATTVDDIIFAGTYGGGIFISYDGGNSWIQQNTGLPSYYIYNIQIDNTDIYISAWASGVYKMKLYGGVILTKKLSIQNYDDIGWQEYGLSGYQVSSLYYNNNTKELLAGTRNGEIYKFVPGAVANEEEKVPETFALDQNYPNPFNPATKIYFTVAQTGVYKIEVFNILGQLVETLINKEYAPGKYSVDFNGINYSSGPYFYRLSGNGLKLTRKMMIIK